MISDYVMSTINKNFQARIKQAGMISKGNSSTSSCVATPSKRPLTR
jgi:hypothetical protein